MFFSKSVPFLYTIVFFCLSWANSEKKSNKNKEYLKKRLFE